MKTYTNGPRKGMMYGGAAKRKPMMYGGMATTKKKPRKKAQAGGMMSTTQGQQNQMKDKQMSMPGMSMPGMSMMPGMAGGGKLKMVTNDAGQKVPFYAADGKGKS